MPPSINLGDSSFYDAFADPGWTLIYYFRFNHLTSINDSSGHELPQFNSPRIDMIVNIFHLLYIPPISVLGGHIGIETLLPIVDLQSHFDRPSVVLHNNGLNISDLTFGSFYQAKPIIVDDRPVFCWRGDVAFIAPIGGFDRSRDLNQSSGFWSITPYLATTLLPLPKWELSARFNYIYNFSTSRLANPPLHPGLHVPQWPGWTRSVDQLREFLCDY